MSTRCGEAWGHKPKLSTIYKSYKLKKKNYAKNTVCCKSFTNEKVGNVSNGNVPHLVVNAFIVAVLGLFIKKLTT